MFWRNTVAKGERMGNMGNIYKNCVVQSQNAYLKFQTRPSPCLAKRGSKLSYLLRSKFIKGTSNSSNDGGWTTCFTSKWWYIGLWSFTTVDFGVPICLGHHPATSAMRRAHEPCKDPLEGTSQAVSYRITITNSTSIQCLDIAQFRSAPRIVAYPPTRTCFDEILAASLLQQRLWRTDVHANIRPAVCDDPSTTSTTQCQLNSWDPSGRCTRSATWVKVVQSCLASRDPTGNPQSQYRCLFTSAFTDEKK